MASVVFNAAWPDVEPLQMAPDPKFPSMMRGREQHECFWCNRLTFWIEVNFQAYLCSSGCEGKAWEDYWRKS